MITASESVLYVGFNASPITLPYNVTVDGNGNVTEYIDAEGAVKAHYEYGPFGGITAYSGDKRNDFTHRFSTKPFEEETGLVLYELRDYSAELGRWLSRDPIGERGGYNLYGFVENEPVAGFDSLGLYSYSLYDLFVEGAAHTEINSFRDALSQYRSGGGGNIQAGAGLYAEMRSDSSYETKVRSVWTADAPVEIRDRLSKVPMTQIQGDFTNLAGSSVWSLSCKTLGSYRLQIVYRLHWEASVTKRRFFGGCYREVSTKVTVIYILDDPWDFVHNPGYNAWQNLTRETIPEAIAGPGAAFNIRGMLKETYDITAEQDF